MELATPLLAADATSPRAKGQTTAAANAPSGFAATLQQLGADGDTADTLVTTGNAGGNDTSQDGKALPLSLDTTVNNTATENPLVTATEDDTVPIVPPQPATAVLNIEAKAGPRADAGAKGEADPAVISLPQNPSHAETTKAAPPVAIPVASTAAPTLDKQDKVAASTPSDAASVTVTEKDQPEPDSVETLAMNVETPPTQEPAKAEVPVPPTPPVPATADPTLATAHGKPLATTAPSPSMTDTLPLSTDRSSAPATVVQAGTTSPGAATVESDRATQTTADTGKALADTGKAFVAPPASDPFTGTGGTAGTNIDATGQDTSALPQAPQSAPPTQAPTPPHAMLAAALLANGAQPSGNNVTPGYTPAFMGSPAWLDAMDAQVSWMQDKGVLDAELKLHPAELGALEISINVQDDKAVVRMVAGTAQARDLLEASLPRLRDMFAANGMQLAHGSVAQGDSQSRQHAPTPRGTPLHDEPATPPPAPRSATLRAASLHRIDHYV